MENLISKSRQELVRFIDDVLPAFQYVDARWISLRIHLYNSSDEDIETMLSTFESHLYNKIGSIRQCNPDCFHDDIFISLQGLKTEFPLLAIWNEVKDDSYNSGMFWKWMIKIVELLDELNQCKKNILFETE